MKLAKAWSHVHYAALGWIKRRGRAVYLWALVSEQPTEIDRQKFSALAGREIDAIRETVVAHFDYQDSEARILSERLARRYDPGMALNEATNRALEAKAAAKTAGMGLTDKQKFALEFQAKSQLRNIRNA